MTIRAIVTIKLLDKRLDPRKELAIVSRAVDVGSRNAPPSSSAIGAVFLGYGSAFLPH